MASSSLEIRHPRADSVRHMRSLETTRFDKFADKKSPAASGIDFPSVAFSTQRTTAEPTITPSATAATSLA